MPKLENAITQDKWRERFHFDISPEQHVSMDRDMHTIVHMARAYKERINARLVLVGGYGVEAQLGGNITRFHKDMDFLLFLDPVWVEKSGVKLWEITREIMQEDPSGKWRMNYDMDDWMLRADSEKENPLSESVRHVDILRIRAFTDPYTFENKSFYGYRGQFSNEIVQKFLIDSTGLFHAVEVPSIEEDTAYKLAEYITKIKQKNRIKETDKYDLYRLLESRVLDLEKCQLMLRDNLMQIYRVKWREIPTCLDELKQFGIMPLTDERLWKDGAPKDYF